MAVVPVIPPINTGVLPSTTEAALAAAISYALNPPIAELRASAVQAITTAVWTAVNFDLEDVDSAGGHDLVTNNSRYTAVYAGWYQVGGAAGFASNVTGRRGARYAGNGTVAQGSEVLLQTPSVAGGMSVPARGKLIFLNVGDYIELQVFQDSGGNLNTGTGTGGCSLSVAWKSN